MQNRRKFIGQTAKIAAGAMLAPSFIQQAFGSYRAPSDRIRLASVGIKGMGWANTMAALKIPGVELVAVCEQHIVPYGS